MRRIIVGLVLFVLSMLTVFAQDTPTGTLEFRANGEDFVRQGFVSKDGWAIQFDHIYISLSNIRAHQTNPPYDPFEGELTRSQVMVGLPDQFVIDLAEGDADAETIVIGTVEDAPEGYYNAVAWMMTPAEDGDIEGYSLVMDGVAEKDDTTIDFIVRIDDFFTYTCGAFVGDARKGIVQADGIGDVEMTFHFDHIFGDADTPLDDSLNVTAPGFDMFAQLATDNVVDVSLSDLNMLLAKDEYQMLVDILPSLGHTGEGHCHESNLGD